MKCDECGLEFEFLWEFSIYGHSNHLKTQEAVSGKSYCDKCFVKKDEELEKLMVYRNINSKQEFNLEKS